jgi:hypothetical protein
MNENKYGTSNSQQGFDDDVNALPEKYKPIGMWAYFGYEILFSIPVIGWIFLLIYSFGNTKNINLRNFARSYFCLVIIVAVLVVIFLIILAAAGLSGNGTTTFNVSY